jgi:peptidoglycan/xylan/chitin deacetylase (PgdA/CDA1 family)
VFVFFWRKKRLFLIAALILLVICIYTAAFASELVVQRKKPIYQGVPAKKQVSITVNVDWGEEHLSAMLEVLQKSRVKATFFMTGRWAGEHPELVNKIARLGHEIGNHGYSHPHVNDLPLEQNIEEIKKTSDVIYRGCTTENTLLCSTIRRIQRHSHRGCLSNGTPDHTLDSRYSGLAKAATGRDYIAGARRHPKRWDYSHASHRTNNPGPA